MRGTADEGADEITPRPDPSASQLSATALISQRNFLPFFLGNALSATGGWFFMLGAAILVYRETGSELMLGVVGFAQFIPALLLAPWAGNAADRLDLRRLIGAYALTGGVISAVVAALVELDKAGVWVVILAAGAQGIAIATVLPAIMVFPASLVDRSGVAAAMALNSVMYNLARVAGPVLAGIVITTLGVAAAFAMSAVASIALALGIFAVKPTPHASPDSPKPRFRDTLNLVRRDPVLLGLLLVVTLAGIISDPINTLSPAFAHAFDRPDSDAGIFLGVFGLGAVTAAFVLSDRLRASRSGLRSALLLGGAGLAVFSITPWLPFALVALFVCGFGYLAMNAAATSSIMLRVDDRERGRVMALWTIAFIGVRPIASLLDGAIASAASVRVAGAVLAVPALAAGLWLAANGLRPRSKLPPKPE